MHRLLSLRRHEIASPSSCSSAILSRRATFRRHVISFSSPFPSSALSERRRASLFSFVSCSSTSSRTILECVLSRSRSFSTDDRNDSDKKAKKKSADRNDKDDDDKKAEREDLKEFLREYERRRRGSKRGSAEDSDDSQGPLPLPQKALLLLVIAGAVVGLALLPMLEKKLAGVTGVEEITLQTFLTDTLLRHEYISLQIDAERGRGRVLIRDDAEHDPQLRYWFSLGTVDGFEAQLAEACRVAHRPMPSLNYSKPNFPLPKAAGAMLTAVLGAALVYVLVRPSAAFGGLMGGLMGSAKRYQFQRPGHGPNRAVTFRDVAGLAEAKQEIEEFVSFLRHPKKYTALGARIPRGALISGPPGTGKTLLAKAVAGEANVPFLSVSGSDFIEMFVGVGPSRVREMFSKARKEAPCIIFIDEIDAIGRSRGRYGSHEERDSTLNQLLVEMDGFNTRSAQGDPPVVMLAGTNRPDVLDKALLRPGRFDRQIHIDLPDMKGRVEILLVHLQPLVTADDKEVLAAQLSSLTAGFSGADLANFCNEAAIIAARLHKSRVELADFHAAIDRQVAGVERKSRRIAPDEKRVIAYHEAGHALTGWLLEHAHPLMKVTIVPRGKALGYAAFNPRDRYLLTADQLLDQMCMTLGGRVAEQLVFGRVTTGAVDDLERVTAQAYAQVSQWGMSTVLGPLAYHEPDAGGLPEEQIYSANTAKQIDEEVRQLVNRAMQRTEQLLQRHLAQLRVLAEELFAKEVLHRDDLVRLIGTRQWPETSDWRRYLPEGKQVPEPVAQHEPEKKSESSA